MLKAMLTLLTMLLFSCESSSAPPAAVEPTAPPPEQIRFPTDAAAARYMFFGDDGQRVVVGTRGEVPDQLLASTAVLMGERTTAPDGQLYVLLPAKSDDRVSVAQLVPEQTLKQEAKAGWEGSYLGLAVWEESMVAAQLLEEGRSTGVRGKRSKRSKRSKKRRKAPPKAPTIEIVGLGGTADADPAPTGRVLGRIWKPVDIYYSPRCGRCRSSMKWMDSNGVNYTKHNIDVDDRAKAEFWAALRRGNSSSGALPAIVIGRERKLMQGWNSTKFTGLAAR